MRASDFLKNMPGRLVKNLDGHLAFVPNPLPGRLEWSNALGSELSKAERAMGHLMGVGLTLPNPRIAVRNFLRREAELSSRIENTFAKVTDLAIFDQTQSVEARVPDVREVANNERVLEFGLRAIERRRISVSLIKEMHRLLLQDTRGEDVRPGDFRNRQVHIGKSSRIEEARFVPPPPLLVPELMEQLLEFIHAPSDLPPLARSAMIHYQFETIHPFVDGNGRIGRVLILMLLYADKILPVPLLNPSAFLDRHRQAYYQHLSDVSQSGAWTEWVSFFARGVAEESADAIKRIDRLIQLRSTYLRRLQSVRASSLLLRLIDELFDSPVISVNRAAELLGVGYTSAKKNIDRLIKVGIVWEISGGARNRLYLAGEIIEAVEAKPLSADLRSGGRAKRAK